nr:immunoglobulin light chain junction region [Macaca mulatta]
DYYCQSYDSNTYMIF